ncbi:MAG: hypothetical protein GWP19_10125 [Planctomycetia bacterium]|nr:hypothetical protein [Planctomycetia bacterium]
MKFNNVIIFSNLKTLPFFLDVSSFFSDATNQIEYEKKYTLTNFEEECQLISGGGILSNTLDTKLHEII